MKIGVITFSNTEDNYGQLLQCWALQQQLKRMGHAPFLIRYNPQTPPSFVYRVCRKIKNIISGSDAFFQTEKELCRSNMIKNRERKFGEFRDNNIISSQQEYNNIDSLRNNPPVADCYITGSDQVWHNSLFDRNTKGWFLDFGERKIKRISYAASIGRDFKKKEIKIFSELMHQFNAISVREESSRQLCETLGLNATVTVDPTLLLQKSDYNCIVNDISIEKETLFLYVLNALTPEDIYWDEIRRFIQTEGIDIHPVFSSGYIQARELCYGYQGYLDTIPQWISTLKESTYVITNSFHGMVFAIIFHRPFIVIPLKGKYNGGNTRILSLLGNLGLENRFYDGNINFSKQLKESIDWSIVDEKLERLRNKSKEFINHCLSL